MAINLADVLQHIERVRELRSGSWAPGRVSRLAASLSLLLAATGVGMAIYLMVVR